MYYFNPRPREEGDLIVFFNMQMTAISIHALVKRATSKSTSISMFVFISIHALVKRATDNRFSEFANVNIFQSTPS